MKPIYYKAKNGDCYKFTLNDNLTNRQIDLVLDALLFEGREFITEEEFNGSTPKTMNVQIMDDWYQEVIGVLTCKAFENNDVEVNPIYQ